jgi:hypothetical protein
MTWVDLAVFGFLAISGLLAFMRGFVREVLGIGAWVGAVAAAILGLPTMRGFVRNWFSSPDWVDLYRGVPRQPDRPDGDRRHVGTSRATIGIGWS